MKRWLGTIGAWLAACLGCHPSTPSKTDNVTAANVVGQLIEMGFLKYVPETEHDRLRQDLVETVRHGCLDTDWYDDCNSADRRGYRADNEDLAEGDVGKSILAMKEVLEREGVRLNSVEDDFGEQGYAVIVNGQRHPIYTSDEVDTKNIWAIALKRHLEIVNGLLEEAGSRERLYGIYGGNDGRTILLTPEMHEYLRSLEGVFDKGWRPYSAAAVSDDGTFTLRTD